MYKKNLLKNSIFIKYIATHIAILLIPIIIVTVVIYTINISKFKEEIIEKNYTSMENIRNVFDIKTNELMTLAQQTFSNTALIDINKGDFVDIMMELKNELSNYVGTNGYVYEMALYVPEIDYVFTSLGASSFNHYTNLLYSFNGMDTKQFREYLKNCETISNIPVEVKILPDARYRCCIIKESDLPSSRYIIILLETESINTIINAYDDDLLIFDSENRFITDNKRKHSIDVETIRNYLSQTNEPVKTIKFDNDKYCVSTVKSSDNGYQYVSIMRERDMFTQVIYLQIVYSAVLVIILIIGVLIITYSMKSFYSPVKKITSMLKGFNNEQGEFSDEFTSAEQGMNYLIQTQKSLADEVERAYEITRDYMLFKLINASISNIDEAKTQFEFYGIHFDFPYYYIALFNIEDIDIYNTSDILKVFREFVKDNNCITTDFVENNKICIILPSMHKNHNEENRSLVDSMKKVLEEITLCPITVCAGNPVDDISYLWHSYIEASSAYDYKLIKGKYGSLFFCDTFFNNQSSYSRKKIELLHTYIKAGEKDKAFLIIDEIADEVYKGELSLHTARCLCFDIANTVMNAAAEVFTGTDMEEVYLKRFDIASLVEFDSIEQLVNNVKLFLADVLNEKTIISLEDKENKRNNIKENMVNKIKQYIDENINQPYMCVDNIADHFKISTTYLGQFFKGKTGVTISDYITNLQIERTKMYLTETDLSIKEIAEELGYQNVSNFIRKFKSKTGVTPGIYRNANIKKDK